MGSAQRDKLELECSRFSHGAKTRMGNEQFELEHVQTHSWPEGLIPIRRMRALSCRNTSGGDTNHKLAVSLKAVSALVLVLIMDRKHEKVVLAVLGRVIFLVITCTDQPLC